MNAIERANDLVQQAIQVLLEADHEIWQRLRQLGYDGEIKTAPLSKKRGRPAKQHEPSVPSDTTQPILSSPL